MERYSVELHTGWAFYCGRHKQFMDIFKWENMVLLSKTNIKQESLFFGLC